MRLVGDFNSEKEVYLVYAFLTKEGIKTTYESVVDPVSGIPHFCIWVYEEDDFEKALDFIKRFKENPHEFQESEPPSPIPPPIPSLNLSGKSIESRIQSPEAAKFKWKIKVNINKSN